MRPESTNFKISVGEERCYESRSIQIEGKNLLCRVLMEAKSSLNVCPVDLANASAVELNP